VSRNETRRVLVEFINDEKRTDQNKKLKEKFHYAILVADRSEAGRRPAASQHELAGLRYVCDSEIAYYHLISVYVTALDYKRSFCWVTTDTLLQPHIFVCKQILSNNATFSPGVWL